MLRFSPGRRVISEQNRRVVFQDKIEPRAVAKRAPPRPLRVNQRDRVQNETATSNPANDFLPGEQSPNRDSVPLICLR